VHDRKAGVRLKKDGAGGGVHLTGQFERHLVRAVGALGDLNDDTVAAQFKHEASVLVGQRKDVKVSGNVNVDKTHC